MQLTARIFYTEVNEAPPLTKLSTLTLNQVKPFSGSASAIQAQKLKELLPEELVMVGWLRSQKQFTALMQTAKGATILVRQGDTIGDQKRQEKVLTITPHSVTTNYRCYEL